MMNDLQSTLAGLMRKNEEYKMQVGASGCQCFLCAGCKPLECYAAC